MMWATASERVALSVLGVSLALGIAARSIQQHHAPLRIESPSFDTAQDGALSAVEGAPPPGVTAAWDARVAHARRVDVNAATAEDLERLPGIGPAMAERIVAYRRAHGAFTQLTDLARVPGVGPNTLETVKAFVTVTE